MMVYNCHDPKLSNCEDQLSSRPLFEERLIAEELFKPATYLRELWVDSFLFK